MQFMILFARKGGVITVERWSQYNSRVIHCWMLQMHNS